MFDPTHVCGIRNFVEFLELCLGCKVIEYSFRPPTKPGDNYGSVLQAVEVKVVAKSDFEEAELLHLVAKTAVTNPYLVDIFQPALTIRNCSFFLNAKRADADAVVLLENTKLLNYVNGDRQVGFNAEETLAILKMLAKFHAFGIANRRLQPTLFDARVSPYLEAANLILNDDDTQMVDSVWKELHFVENLSPKLCIDIEKQLRICYEFTRDTKRTADTPFTTQLRSEIWGSIIS